MQSHRLRERGGLQPIQLHVNQCGKGILFYASSRSVRLFAGRDRSARTGSGRHIHFLCAAFLPGTKSTGALTLSAVRSIAVGDTR
jgi:hypothetical protein